MTAETSRAVPNGNGDGPELIRVVPRAVLSAEETVEEAVARRLAFFADQMVDEAAMLAASTFPISPEVGWGPSTGGV
jgi:hypothetical protein